MTSAHAPRFDDLLPAYALGALDGDELRELEAHLATGCPTCEGERRRLAAERRLALHHVFVFHEQGLANLRCELARQARLYEAVGRSLRTNRRDKNICV